MSKENEEGSEEISVFVIKYVLEWNLRTQQNIGNGRTLVPNYYSMPFTSRKEASAYVEEHWNSSIISGYVILECKVTKLADINAFKFAILKKTCDIKIELPTVFNASTRPSIHSRLSKLTQSPRKYPPGKYTFPTDTKLLGVYTTEEEAENSLPIVREEFNSGKYEAYDIIGLVPLPHQHTD